MRSNSSCYLLYIEGGWRLRSRHYLHGLHHLRHLNGLRHLYVLYLRCLLLLHHHQRQSCIPGRLHPNHLRLLLLLHNLLPVCAVSSAGIHSLRRLGHSRPSTGTVATVGTSLPVVEKAQEGGKTTDTDDGDHHSGCRGCTYSFRHLRAVAAVV